MRNRIKNLILGAGITGLSTAYHLKNKDYLIIEKETEIGGLARSKKIKGFTFDYSAHLLHPRTKYFSNWLQKNMGDQILLHKRNAWIYSYGVYTKYPFQANLYGLPKNIVKECLQGLLEIKERKSQQIMNFEEWSYRKFGSGISRHFMIPYNRKFWTLHPRYLTTEWIDGFIPQPNPRDILEGTFEYAKKEFGYHSKFFYPLDGGIEVFPQELFQRCKNIILGEEVKSINIKEKWIETLKGKRFYFENLVSTLPLVKLKEMVVKLKPDVRREFSKLRFISVLNLNLGIKREYISKKDWVYFPEEEFIFYRIGFPMNFAPASTPKGYSSIYVDISYSDFRGIDKQALVEKVKADLIKAGVIEENDEIVLEDLNDIKYAYVVYDYNWAETRQAILRFLRNNDIYPGGRLGAWHYLSMEGCFLEGKNLAQTLDNL